MLKDSFGQALSRLTRENARTHINAAKQTEYETSLRHIARHYLQELDQFKRGTLLDLGCAYGTQSAAFKELGFDVTAADALPHLTNIKWLASRGVDFETLNIEEEPLKGDFGFVVMSEVLEHLQYNPVKAMRNVYDSMAEQGVLLLSTPMKELKMHRDACTGRWCSYAHYRDIPEPWNGYEFRDEHHHLYSERELRQLLEEAGFYVHEVFPAFRGLHHYAVAIKDATRS